MSHDIYALSRVVNDTYVFIIYIIYIFVSNTRQFKSRAGVASSALVPASGTK